MFYSQSFPLGPPSKYSWNHMVSYHIMTITFVQMSSSLCLTGLSERSLKEFACSHKCPQPQISCFLLSNDAPAVPSHSQHDLQTAQNLCRHPVLTPDTANPPLSLTSPFWLPAACVLLNPALSCSPHPGATLASGHLAPDLWLVVSAEDSNERVMGAL